MKNIAATTNRGVIALLRSKDTNLALVLTQDLDSNEFVRGTLETAASINDGVMMLFKGAAEESTAIIAINLSNLTILKWTVKS